MASGKKAEKALTPEEKLAQALVPVERQPYPVPENWCWTYLTIGFAECMDSFRKPINATERANRIGDVPYYGATGQVGWIDDFLTNEQLVLEPIHKLAMDRNQFAPDNNSAGKLDEGKIVGSFFLKANQ